MSLARVIPLQRLPVQRPWFDYAIPAGVDVRVGQLVTISFRRHVMSGIVWELTDDPATENILPIEGIINPEPLLSAWQQSALDHASRVHCVSLGTLLKSVIPQLPKRPLKPRAASAHPASDLAPVPAPDALTWWYRDRRVALGWILDHVTGSGQQVVIAPTIEDISDIAAHLRAQGHAAVELHSRLTPGQYATVYMRILRGERVVVVGTSRALLLPYPEPPRVVIDQEEHHGHHLSQQHPRLDPKTLTRTLLNDTCVTTPAPSLAWVADHPVTPPAPSSTRQIGDLTGRHELPWMSLELEAMLRDVPAGGSAVLIVPDTGVADGVMCQDCHSALPCPTCGRHLAMQRSGPSIVCRFCRGPVTVPSTCPFCHGARMKLTGISADRLASILRTTFPTVTTDEQATEGILIGPYAAYRRLRQAQRPSGIAVVAGDALLQYPDPFILERAWQYLARVQAEQPSIPCIVQSYEPSSDFWQRWKHSRDGAWYKDELQSRRRHNLPPFVDQWIAYYSGRDAARVLSEKIRELDGLHIPSLSVQQLPPMQKHASHTPKERLVLTLREGQLHDRLPWMTVFPHPWQLETLVTSWRG